MVHATKRRRVPFIPVLCLLVSLSVFGWSNARLVSVIVTVTLPPSIDDAPKPWREQEESDRRNRNSPRIAVLQLVTPEVAQTYALSTSQIGCWSARQGYYHHIEAYYHHNGSNVDDEGRGPPVRDAKIHHAVKYLPHYDWLLLLDADVNVANLDCRIESYLPPPLPPPVAATAASLVVQPTNESSPLPWRGDFDLVLGVREHTGEPMSGAVLVRNSPWGRDFLNTWNRLSADVPGSDNWSMILALLELLNGTLPTLTLPCKSSPKYVCLYKAIGGKVGMLPHLLLRPAFHHLMTTLWDVQHGYFPHDCIVHGKSLHRHLRPLDGLRCPIREEAARNWTRPELLRTDAEAREGIRKLAKKRGIPLKRFTGWVKHGKIAECYPNCLDDPRVSWTMHGES